MREGLTLDDARTAFLSDVAITHAPLSHKTYAYQLGKLTPGDWPLSRPVCQNLVARQMREGKANSTVQMFAGVLASFTKWLTLRGHYAENPMQGVVYPKRDKDKPHRVLSAEEQARLDQAVQTSEERNILALLRVGLRAAELLAVRVEDIEDGLILVRGKGARWRYVPCPALDLPESGPVVPLDYRRLLRRVHGLGRRAKIPGLHPHRFRHSWATDSIEGHDLPTVQAVGGWASPEMLEWYTRSRYRKAAALRMRELR